MHRVTAKQLGCIYASLLLVAQGFFEGLDKFKYHSLYMFFAEHACRAITPNCKACHNFHTGVIGCLFVDVNEFFTRKAVPEWASGQSQIEWPKSFAFGSLLETFLLSKSTPPEKACVHFESGQVPGLLVCFLHEHGVPAVDALLSGVSDGPVKEGSHFVFHDQVFHQGQVQIG